jgi:hypothetical protein
MLDPNPNNQTSSSSNDQQIQPVTPQTPEPIQREFIHIDTAENSRLNKGAENDIEIKSSSNSDT